MDALTITIALSIFVLTYVFIITEKINRAVAALAGATLMILFQVIGPEDAFHHIQWNTITLLIGMMILVGVTNKTGVFQYVAVKSSKKVKGNPIKILIILSLLTAVGSAFLDNVTTVLLFVPVTFSITRILGVNPIPFLFSEILFANIGGTATLIGDPPNIMIGQAVDQLTFNSFIINLAPVVAVIAVATVIILYFMYRNRLEVSDEKRKKLMEMDEHQFIQDPKLMKKSLIVLGMTIIGFLLHAVIHVDAAAIAMGGAVLLLIIGVKDNQVDEAFGEIEWVTIFFFAGLFTLVGALVEVGIIEYLAKQALEVTGGNIAVAAMLILWVSGITSAVIDNIPYVATMIPLIQSMAEGMGIADDPSRVNILWWSLALGACLGGNATLIGASANVIVAGMAAREGHGFTYIDYLKVGAPLTFVALVISTIYIWLRYLAPIM